MNKQQLIETILRIAASKDKFQVSALISLGKVTVSRQYVSIVLKELVTSGQLVTSGSKRYTYYALPQNSDALIDKETRTLVNEGLKEHVVFEEFIAKAAIAHKLNENASSIINFAFSEMLNNAIEHSSSEKIRIELFREDKSVVFVIRDFGLGVYETIKNRYKLNTDLEAVQELLKGKITSAPQAHSGEGIFFTSKAADLFVLESFNTRLRIDNDIHDVFIESRKPALNGTKVTIRINMHTKKHLSDVFKLYYSDQESFAFDKTVVLVKLYIMGTVYISRSQARRILSNIENKFKVLVLDFDKVPTVGQAFADEIFRVFSEKHPAIEIKAVNMNENVAFMVERAKNTGKMG